MLFNEVLAGIASICPKNVANSIAKTEGVKGIIGVYFELLLPSTGDRFQRARTTGTHDLR